MLHHKSPEGCKILHHTAINECKTCGDTIWYLHQIRAVQHMLILLAWLKTWCYFTYSLPDIKSRLSGRGASSNSWFLLPFCRLPALSWAHNAERGRSIVALRSSLVPALPALLPRTRGTFCSGQRIFQQNAPGPHFFPPKKK